MAPSRYAYRVHTQKKAGGRPDYIDTWTSCTSCDSIEASRRYTQRLMPGVHLDYIPKHERDILNWVGERQYLDPKKGLIHWCHSGAPKSKEALMRTRMYVVGDLVGATVEAVVKAAKKEGKLGRPLDNNKDPDWVAREEVRHIVWQETECLRQIAPSHFWGRLDTVEAEEMYKLVANKGATVLDFLSWLDICPRPSELEALSSSMSLLSVAEATGGYETDGWGEWEAGDTDTLKEALSTFLTDDWAEVTAEPPSQNREVD